MDYSVSYSDRFTDDQRDRIRHVLTYSPLIPGPKSYQTFGNFTTPLRFADRDKVTVVI